MFAVLKSVGHGRTYAKFNFLNRRAGQRRPSLRCSSLVQKAVKEKEVRKNDAMPSVLDWRGSNFPQEQGPGVVILIDKPKTWTSFDVVAKVRSYTRKLGVKKVGHCGTLDPMATGLLIIVCGKATKLADMYQAKDKKYSGTIKLGEKTSSGDADNEVIETKAFDFVNDEMIEEARRSLVGDIDQIPPMYSALSVNGRKLYEIARDGETIERASRRVHIDNFSVKRRLVGDGNDENNEKNNLIDFEITCSKGTYVRTIAEDFCEKMGTVGHLVKLRREKIGDFDVKDAFVLPELLEKLDVTVREFRADNDSKTT